MLVGKKYLNFKEERMKKKLLSFSLALMMVLSVVCLPMQAFAKEEQGVETKYGVENSYIKATVKGNGFETPNYVTVTTIPKQKTEYKNVVRGDIFVPIQAGTNITRVNITLKAQKEFGFTLNGDEVSPGQERNFNLNLTKANTIKLNIPEGHTTFKEGSYTISAGDPNQNITVKVGIDVSNPQAWLDGKYVPKMGEIESSDTHPEAELVKKALKGFGEMGTTPITVKKGTTATEVFREFGKINNIEMEGLDQGYIRRINKVGFPAIGEFNINRYSGWMYTVNDGQGWYMPNVGVAGHRFTDNASMNWNFTMAYGQDIDAGWGSPKGGSMPYAVRSYRFAPSIEDLVPQWANSGRSLDLVK